MIVPEHPGFGQSDTPAWLDTISDSRISISISSTSSTQGVSSRRQLARRLDCRGSRRAQCLAPRLAHAHRNRPASRSTAWPRSIPFLISEEQRIRHLFHDQELAEAVVANSGGRRREDAAQEPDDDRQARRQPRNHDPHLRKWLHRIKVPTLLVWGADDGCSPRTTPSLFSN